MNIIECKVKQREDDIKSKMREQLTPEWYEFLERIIKYKLECENKKHVKRDNEWFEKELDKCWEKTAYKYFDFNRYKDVVSGHVNTSKYDIIYARLAMREYEDFVEKVKLERYIIEVMEKQLTPECYTYFINLVSDINPPKLAELWKMSNIEIDENILTI